VTLALRALSVALALWTSSASAGPVLETELIPPPERIQLGSPLKFEIRIRNAGDANTGPLGIYSGYFALTHYAGLSDEGCELAISIPNPLPGPVPPPIFGFTWIVKDLAPDEALTCKINFPSTTFPGAETILISSIVNSVHRPEGSFTYSLVAPPQPVTTLSVQGLIMLMFLSMAAACVRLRGPSERRTRFPLRST
jgi:hypothetical protein